MKVFEDIIAVLAFVAVALLLLGLARNAEGVFTALNGLANLFNTGYQAEISGIGSGSHQAPPPGGWRGN